MNQTSSMPVDEKSPAMVHRKSPAVMQRRSIPTDRKSPMIVVQIRYDAQKSKYIAKDINSDLGILRHEDSARLRAMCDRLGWQIV